jgi:hypothetical protein
MARPVVGFAVAGLLVAVAAAVEEAGTEVASDFPQPVKANAARTAAPRIKREVLFMMDERK